MKRNKGARSETDRDELERQIEGLQRDIRNLQLEHDLLKKANELIKKDLGVDLPLLSNREMRMRLSRRTMRTVSAQYLNEFRDGRQTPAS